MSLAACAPACGAKPRSASPPVHQHGPRARVLCAEDVVRRQGALLRAGLRRATLRVGTATARDCPPRVQVRVKCPTPRFHNPAPRARRYSALKTLGEKKACFHEYVQARKVTEVAEKRAAVKAAREGARAMLEACADLKPGTRFSRASALLDDDPRWRARARGPDALPRRCPGVGLRRGARAASACPGCSGGCSSGSVYCTWVMRVGRQGPGCIERLRPV